MRWSGRHRSAALGNVAGAGMVLSVPVLGFGTADAGSAPLATEALRPLIFSRKGALSFCPPPRDSGRDSDIEAKT